MGVYLNKLELLGFKSFPDKTMVKLHQGITAIIGPNGCGKSNIVDAILWVLGEQRIKNLRGENNEDLIFSGSSSMKPLGMSEVGAYFMNNNEELYLARRFFRNGEGKFIINDKYCRNKDIQDQLHNIGLGERKYFIFEQGSIDKLISLKASEKRALIEEAAGISQYLERKRETANKLIIAEQNLENIAILITDKSERLREVKNQVSYVQRYRKIQNRRVEAVKALLKKKYEEFQKGFAGQKTNLETLINQESALVRALSSNEKRILTLEEQRWELDKSLKQHQKDRFDVNNQITSAKGEIVRLTQQIDFNGRRIDEQKNAKSDGAREIKELDGDIVKQKTLLNNLSDQLKSETAGFSQLENRVNELNLDLNRLNEKEKSLKAEGFSFQSRLSQIRNQAIEREKRAAQLSHEIAGKKGFIEELQRQVENQDVKDLRAGIAALEESLSQKRADFESNSGILGEMRTKSADLDLEIKRLKGDIGSLESQKERYRAIKDKISGSNEDDSNGKRSLALLDMLEADKRYFAILENFYHDELDARLVSDNLDAVTHPARKILLRGNSASESLPESIKKMPGVIGFLKDHFNLSDESVKPYIRDGVLVDTLSHAIEVYAAFGIDVVSESGEFIGRNGVLIRNREKGILDVMEDIRQTEIEISRLTTEKKQAEKAVEEILDRTEVIEKKVSAQQESLRQEEGDLLSRQSKIESLLHNLESNRKRIELTAAEIELFELDLEKITASLGKIHTEESGIKAEGETLSKEREKLASQREKLVGELQEFEKKHYQKENQANLLREKQNSCAMSLNNLENSHKKLMGTVKAAGEDVAKLQVEIEGIDRRLEQLQQSIGGMDQKRETMSETVTEEEQAFTGLSSEIKEATAVLNEQRRSLETLREEKSNFEISLSSHKKDLYQLEDMAFKELNTELKNIELPDDYAAVDLAALEIEVDESGERLEKMRESNRLNFSAESEFELLERDTGNLAAQKDDVIQSIEDLNEAIKKIDEESKISFKQAFTVIQENFLKNFNILFEGGEAEMALTDESNVLESGLEIKAQPPGKRLQSLRLLSGGEKTLTSLAFLFALFEFKPAPFCVFDEVDASLDEANIQRFLHFLQKLKEKTQFLIITHNFKTMEAADYLYGISMNEAGISSVYSMKMVEGRPTDGSGGA